MSAVGALVGAVFMGAIGAWLFQGALGFWLFFLPTAIFGTPIGMLMDASNSSREQKEKRADARSQDQANAIAKAIEKGRPNVNIDARSVHYHQN